MYVSVGVSLLFVLLVVCYIAGYIFMPATRDVGIPFFMVIHATQRSS